MTKSRSPAWTSASFVEVRLNHKSTHACGEIDDIGGGEITGVLIPLDHFTFGRPGKADRRWWRLSRRLGLGAPGGGRQQKRRDFYFPAAAGRTNFFRVGMNHY